MEAYLQRTMGLSVLGPEHIKDYDWSVGLVYDPRGLIGVMTARPRVSGVLQRMLTRG
jgi:hypothetical protein